MITTRKKLREVIALEKKIYFPSNIAYMKALFLRERDYFIWQYQKGLRKLELYYHLKNKHIIYAVLYAIYSMRVNNVGIKIGIDAWHSVFETGLKIHHSTGGIIINSGAKVGENCVLHGNNCIGNNGITPDAPHIGNNCNLGVGSKIIGNVRLGNNITVAAGSIVIRSCLEDGVILAGVPAKVKYRFYDSQK